jgi:FMN phosphatase YigB (HAD superfamily)
MKIYIFDLDDTLLYKPYKTYDDIEIDDELQYLLNTNNYPKYIFSNATTYHVNISLRNLGILNNFIRIFARDKVPLMKPYPEAYNYVNTNILRNIYYNYNQDVDIYFFDDLIENLYMAKKHGWITILIKPFTQSNKIYSYIDYHFETIVDALYYFKKLEIEQPYNLLNLD